MSECGISDLADMAVDSCLERVRVVDETKSVASTAESRGPAGGAEIRKHAGTGHADARPATGQPRSDVSDSAPPGMFDNSVEVPSHPSWARWTRLLAARQGSEFAGAGPSNVDRSGALPNQLRAMFGFRFGHPNPAPTSKTNRDSGPAGQLTKRRSE